MGIVERHDLPRPKVNGQVEGYEVDFIWPDRTLIVETDGFTAAPAGHSKPTAFATAASAGPGSGRSG